MEHTKTTEVDAASHLCFKLNWNEGRHCEETAVPEQSCVTATLDDPPKVALIGSLPTAFIL